MSKKRAKFRNDFTWLEEKTAAQEGQVVRGIAETTKELYANPSDIDILNAAQTWARRADNDLAEAMFYLKQRIGERRLIKEVRKHL